MRTREDLLVLMDIPDYMRYVPESTYLDGRQLDDMEGAGLLEMGYVFEKIAPGAEVFFALQFQVKPDILDDQVYTVAWASALLRHSVVPLFSNVVESRIQGEAGPAAQVSMEAMPPAGEKVSSGFQIVYNYTLHNVGSETAKGVMLTTFAPDFTTCQSGCGQQVIGDLMPNELRQVSMVVEVNADLKGATEIINPGYDLEGGNITAAQNRNPVVHELDALSVSEPADGDFTVNIVQKPNVVLNSANYRARADRADRTETKYTFTYLGLNKTPVYPHLDRDGEDIFRENRRCSYPYPHERHAYTYAYNSYGGNCENLADCPIVSTPIVFKIKPVLPSEAPKLVFTKNIPTYSYGDTTDAVNNFMQNGERIVVPVTLTESRAVKDGALGIIEVEVLADVSEDKWVYREYAKKPCRYRSSGTWDIIPIPLYRWEKFSSRNIPLNDTDTTDITVYTATAWLKTEDGHLGTNDYLAGGAQTQANYVDLGVPGFRNHLTPSEDYTPPRKTNADYMIFSREGVGSFKSKSGDSWEITGTQFPFLQRGEVYDRAGNPRDYYRDLLEQEKFGEVRKDKLPSLLSGTVNIGDDIIWHNTGDITIGSDVVFAGGQARIYTDGDVYINGNVRYKTSQSRDLNDITAVRIDARNIYVNGNVTDLEVMLLARGTFKSGKSKKQLRILGDVIAGQAIWEREPLNEYDPYEFNRPSEHIIEDMRKYIVPVPGDTEIPDDYNAWQQVNPGTGGY